MGGRVTGKECANKMKEKKYATTATLRETCIINYLSVQLN